MLERILKVIREGTGLHEHFARPIAKSVLQCLNEEFLGEQVYFGQDRQQQYAQAMAEFNGSNRDEVCAKYDISVATFYRLLNQKKKPAEPARRRAGGDFSL